ncbi:hypothetical protein MUP05_07790 [Candidatus Bathyarchaeota archaeon]|nr:hypothetical protein [Candidatus Bathyarchaeota archaeon]
MVNWHNSAEAMKAIYDRLRGSSVIEFLASATRGSGATNSASKDLGTYAEAMGFAKVTAKVGTSPTLDIKFQGSHDGTNFADLGDAFTQITTEGTYLKKLAANFGKHVRAVCTIGGSDTPTFTFSLNVVAKS